MKPKDISGLGFMRVNVVNKVCLLKLGWHLQAGGCGSWSEVL